MIKTRFDVTIAIDTNTFNVTVRELAPNEKKFLEKIGEEQKKIFAEQSERERAYEENGIAISEAQSALEVNKKMLELVELKDKIALFIEIKKQGFEIARLKKERLRLERSDITKANDALERIYKEKFNFVIEGEHKDALRSAIEENNVSYSRVWSEIDEQIGEQTKKKSIASEDGRNK